MTGAGTKIVRTFIWGSVVSRETFEYLPSRFRLLKYVARQSIVSAGTDADHLKGQLRPIESPLQRRMVHADLAGSGHKDLMSAAPEIDLLLLDIVDERGGIIDLGSSYATRLHELWTAGGQQAAKGRPHIAFATDEHFALWSVAADRLRAHLAELGLIDRTLVLRTPWANLYEDGQEFKAPPWMVSAVHANANYERYFSHLGKLGFRVLSLPQSLARTTTEHRWGASPFHYTDQAYRYLAAEIERHAPVQERSVLFTRRDTRPWGRFSQVSNIDDLKREKDVPNLLTVWHGGYPIDIKVESIGAQTTLVSFHAALGTSGLRPPVFTGRTVTNNIGVNRIFVSDPGLLSDHKLGLAWYLGTTTLDLTNVLTDIISTLQTMMGAEHLAFFGMSGGGFASLNYALQFPGSLALPVNPQTRILDYGEAHWDAMARKCFGTGSSAESRRFLESHPRADQRRLYARGFSNAVIYLQNSSDGHVRRHMIPWFEAIQWDSRAVVRMGHWGKGHVPPTASEMQGLLANLAQVDGDWGTLAQRWGASPASPETLHPNRSR